MDDRKQAALDARRQYQREWRKANRNRVREYNQNFWIKKAAELEQKAREAK